MKRTLIAFLTLVTMIVAGNAFAAGTATVDISATVLGTCSFSAGDTFTFAALDPTSGASPSLTQNAVTFACTNGTGYTITDDGGLLGTYDLDDSGGNLINYNFAYAAAGIGTGANQNLSITVDIPFANYQNSPAGAYADTVTLTINP